MALDNFSSSHIENSTFTQVYIINKIIAIHINEFIQFITSTTISVTFDKSF
ncbi:MAG: hypothetical protein P1U46_02390 [Patescibacteria group bacterium]|nr:hypothetical protein [Patescibacteria group bacterium]